MGADVRAAGTGPDEPHDEAVAFAAETGAVLVEDGRDAAIAEGAGTIGMELLRWPEPFDAIVVPLGDGALLGGVARWVKAHVPATRMVGVCAAGSPAMERSWRRGQVAAVLPKTIADGISIQTPFEEAVADLRGDCRRDPARQGRDVDHSDAPCAPGTRRGARTVWRGGPRGAFRAWRAVPRQAGGYRAHGRQSHGGPGAAMARLTALVI